MDASAVVSQCSWILAEMIRHAQHGASGMPEAQDAVSALMRRRYPLLEEIDGHTYFHASKPSGTDVALVILLKVYPARLSPAELFAQLRSNKFSESNARMAISRIERYVHRDAAGKLVLLAPGVEKAEQILQSAGAAADRGTQ
jgi:hypothetical protein